jgi:hypothetical protein
MVKEKKKSTVQVNQKAAGGQEGMRPKIETEDEEGSKVSKKEKTLLQITRRF